MGGGNRVATKLFGKKKKKKKNSNTNEMQIFTSNLSPYVFTSVAV